ncbi:hypothetical protein OSTOST_19729 [Ostertagia ostertagi]
MPLHFFDDAGRRARNVAYVRQDPWRNMSVNQSLIRQRFRFTDEQLDWITDLLSPMLGRDDQQPWAIIVVGDTAGCSQKTVSNIIQRVVDALVHPDIVQRFIKFKPEDEQWCRARSNEFARTGRMSNVIGAVDGTLVRIRTPAVDGWQYVSRKGTSCLNVCIIADAVGRILYVNSGSPGSVHDAAVWRNSAPAAAFNSGVTVAGYRLLGDMGYGNGGGIMTPFRPTAVQGRREEKRDITAIIAMTIGRLKSRFPILSSELRVGPQRASKIVIACAVLHNISLCLHATAMRQLGSRKATMAHPGADVADVRAYIMERMLKSIAIESTSSDHDYAIGAISDLPEKNARVAEKDVTFRGRCPRRGVVNLFRLVVFRNCSEAF